MKLISEGENVLQLAGGWQEKRKVRTAGLDSRGKTILGTVGSYSRAGGRTLKTTKRIDSVIPGFGSETEGGPKREE